MSKLQDIRELAQEHATSVSSSPRDWMGYMDTAARLYRYPFTDQLLIHAQHPQATACASLELWNHPEIESAVVFLLNRNLGGAVITNHKVHQGLSMHSGTLEHICIDPEGPECYCGQKGCLETYCSANALEAAAQMPVKEFFPALRAGNDARLTEIWDAYLSHLAYAMKTANLLLDGAVIVSGYLAPYFKEEDCRTLLEKVNAASPFPLVREQLLVGTHGQYTPAIGAALLFIEEFLQSEF
jgi:predicted NBD/HSP70 family sugar kinase